MNWIRALILLGLLTPLAAAQGGSINSQGTPLQPGTPIERQIGPGQNHSYSINVPEDNLVQITVEQQGIDLVVNIYSPGGKKVGEYDSPNGDNGPENLSFVSGEKGLYSVQLTPLTRESGVPVGRYQIKIVELRPATDEEIKSSKNLDALKGRAVALLAEVDLLIPEIRVPQTRIRAQVQAAQMLWTEDEKQALKYMNDAIAGVKELYANVDPNSKEFFRTYHNIAYLRYELIQILMQRQPEMALSFLRGTPPFPDPFGNQRDQLTQESMLELEIANQISKNDPKRTLEIARENLKTRYSANLAGVVSTLRPKNPEMAADLAGEIANKLLTDKLLKNPQAPNLLISLLSISESPRRNQSAGTNGSTPPRLLSEQQYRDLLQKALSEALAYKPPGYQGYYPERENAWSLLQGLRSMAAEVDAVMNGGSAAVEKKLNELSAVNNNPQIQELNKYQTAINDQNIPFDDTLASVPRAPKEYHEQLYAQLASRAAMNGDTAKARQIITDHIKNPYQRQQALANIEQQETQSAMQKGKIEEALKNIAAISNMQERAQLLIQVAGQIGPGHKRAAALNLLEQARALLSPTVQAPDTVQMGAFLEIARAFSRYDSKRAFEIIDPLVDQVNELTIAARTLDGFGMEFYDQDELNLNNGNAVGNAATQLTSTLGTLAIGNFDRAKATADRIRLPEVRLRAYLDMAQQALQPNR